MRGKAIIYLIVLVIALIVGFFQDLVDNLAGCTDKLLAKFEQLELAQVYEEEYLKQLTTEKFLPGDTKFINTYWDIKRQDNGCKVQFVAVYSMLKKTVYYGDEFFINLDDRTIYPISAGAQRILDYYQSKIK